MMTTRTYQGQYVSDVEGGRVVQTGSVFPSEQRQLRGQLVHHRVHRREKIFRDQHEEHALKRLYPDLGPLHGA